MHYLVLNKICGAVTMFKSFACPPRHKELFAILDLIVTADATT
ncbi:MAG: hypothetical protein QF785_07900 [Phycisphaeraceae bacterium]|jgi:hypothetical protein|nr:hypothetical protein [Phycisphaeraceae bacterium]